MNVETYAEADGVQVLVLELDVWVLLSDAAGAREEKTISLSHNVGLKKKWKKKSSKIEKYLVDAGNALTALGTGVLEGVAADLLGGILSDQLDWLDNAIDNFVLNTRVLT